MRTTLLTLLLLIGPAAATAQTRPDPGTDTLPRFAAGCLEARERASGVALVLFEGRRFDAMGEPEPIHADNLEPMGSLGGVPLFAGRLAQRPVVDLWMPVCRPADHYQLYTRIVGEVGRTGP